MMISLRLVCAVVALLAFLSPLSSALPATTRQRRSTSLHLLPHHLRIGHLSVDTHPDLVVNSPHPTFAWQLTAELDSTTGAPLRAVTQTAYQLQLLEGGADGVFRMLDEGLSDTGVVTSNASVGVVHPLSLQPMRRYVAQLRYWSSSGSVSGWVTASFRTAMMDTWRAVPAAWIGSRDIPMHQLRKTFSLPLLASASSVVSATVQMSGIGYSTLLLNGAPVDPTRKLDPGWTTYEKRTLYVTFDVAHLLLSGHNAIGVELGSGWYSQEQYITGMEEDSYGPPRLWFWLTAQLADNSTINVYSDPSWMGATGPTIHDGVYMGSILDNRWLRPNWAKAGYVDPLTLWVNATVLPSPLGTDGVFALQIMDPIRTAPDNLHVATSAAAHPGQASQSAAIIGGDLVKDNGGVFTPTQIGGSVEGQPMDMGQNMAGWCRFRAMGKRGMSLVVKYSETLTLTDNPQVANSLYTENLRTAASTDTFIFATDDAYEWFEPPFTVHGFRYLEFRGAKHTIQPSDVQCYFVHSETTMVGNFSTSNAVMNQVQHNIQWGQLSNLMSLPTDCPQRDERKGWLGDAGLTVDESLFNFDSAAFYINFLDLIRDIQGSDGTLTDTVPLTYGGRPADPNWGTAYPQIVYNFYRHYGDLEVVQDHYRNVKMWVEYLRSDYNRSKSITGLEHAYGDWVPPPPYGQTDGGLIAAFPFLRDVQTVLTLARLVNDTATITEYTALYKQLAGEYHAAWWHNSTVGYADGMQTANALSLALPGVVPANLQDDVVNALVRDIMLKGHLTTGIVGVAQLFPVLSANGQHDTALFLAQSTSYPSYGWMFSNDVPEIATTLWELWDSPREGPSMNSRNHIMFGSVGAWFYRDVAGIQLEGLEHVTIRPRMGYDASLMPEVHAEVVTVKGPVTVDYVRSQGDQAGKQQRQQSIELSVQLPVNTQGVVHLEPLVRGGRCVMLQEGGRTLMADEEEVQEVQGVREVSVDEATGVVSVQVGSGAYRFSAKWM